MATVASLGHFNPGVPVTSVGILLIVLTAMIISTSSLRRQGRITRGMQMVVIGVFVGVLIAVAVLAWRNAAP